MRRVQVATSRIFAKSKEAALSPEASATIVQVLKIASTINIPFCQTACSAAISFIEMGEAAGTNDRQWKMLLDIIGVYARQVSEFITTVSEGQPPNFIVVSNDLRATIAREAVKDFEINISRTKDKIEARLRNGKIKKWLAATAIQEEIVECRQMMADARDQFTGRVLNVLTINSARSLACSIPPEEPNYDIPGARTLRGQDIEILEDIEIATLVQDSFWTNLVRVEIDKKVRIAKIYSPSNGGKGKFEKDLQFFAEHWTPMMAHVLGYNSHSQLPFAVFTSVPAQSIVEYWSNHWGSDRGSNWLARFGSLGTQIERVTEYLFKHIDRRNVLELRKFYVALRDATVDLNGKLLVAPLTHDSATEFYNCTENVATHITSRYSQRYWTDDFSNQDQDLHPRRSLIAFSYWPFYSQDQLVRTWSVGGKILASLYQRWPYSGQPVVEGNGFGNVSIGDVLNFFLSGNKVVANLAKLAGSVSFYPPGKPTSQMNVYRFNFYGKEIGGVKNQPCISWFSEIDSKRVVELRAVCRQIADHTRRRGVELGCPLIPNIAYTEMPYFAVVTAVQHFLELGDYPIHSSSQPAPEPNPYLYLYFSPQNEYISARWSFQPEPPSEAEALKEASLLSSYSCPKVSSRPKSSISEYLCFDGEMRGIDPPGLTHDETASNALYNV